MRVGSGRVYEVGGRVTLSSAIMAKSGALVHHEADARGSLAAVLLAVGLPVLLFTRGTNASIRGAEGLDYVLRRLTPTCRAFVSSEPASPAGVWIGRSGQLSWVVWWWAVYVAPSAVAIGGLQSLPCRRRCGRRVQYTKRIALACGQHSVWQTLTHARGVAWFCMFSFFATRLRC